MSTNPYDPPNSLPVEPSVSSSRRTVAIRNVQRTYLILLVPAVYNFVCLAFAPPWNRFVLPIHPWFQAVNSLGFIVVGAIIWSLALPILEFATIALHSLFGGKKTRVLWREELYKSTHFAPRLALCGSVLWFLWTIAFYTYAVNFYVISVPVALLGHLLAAGFYIPLFYRWYRIEHTSLDS